MNGRRIQVLGDPSLMQRACGKADLRTLKWDDDAWLLWTMEDGGAGSFPQSPSLSAKQ